MSYSLNDLIALAQIKRWVSGHLSGSVKDYNIKFIDSEWLIMPKIGSTISHNMMFVTAFVDPPFKVRLSGFEQPRSSNITPLDIKNACVTKMVKGIVLPYNLFNVPGVPLVTMRNYFPNYESSAGWADTLSTQFLKDMFYRSHDALELQDGLIDAGMDQYAW